METAGHKTELIQRLKDATYEAEAEAWKALAKYKFWMFGYYAARWVTLNRLSGDRRPNPFKKLVGMAKTIMRDITPSSA